MTGRPEAPLPDSGPFVPLARRLRQLREQRHMSYRQLSEIAMYSPPALAVAASGRILPPLQRLRSFLAALKVTPEELAEVLQLWHAARDANEQAKRTQRHGPGKPVDESEDQTRVISVAGELVDVTVPVEARAYFTANPELVESYEQFATALTQILSESGLSVRQVIENSSTLVNGKKTVRLSKTTVYDVLNGRGKPSPGFTDTFLRACGMSPAVVRTWVQRLREIHAANDTLVELTKQSSRDDASVNWPQIRSALNSDQVEPLQTIGDPLNAGWGYSFRPRPDPLKRQQAWERQQAWVSAAARPLIAWLSSEIITGPGGVMTDDVGVVTGRLELRSDLRGGTYTLRVRYAGTDEWHSVTGCLQEFALPGEESESALRAMHTVAVALLDRPGK